MAKLVLMAFAVLIVGIFAEEVINIDDDVEGVKLIRVRKKLGRGEDGRGGGGLMEGRKLTKKRKKTINKDNNDDVLDLQGRWRENQYQRTGLSDLLYELGMPWWKRFYATSTNWENEQTIVQQKPNIFRIYGFKGPQAEVYSYTLTADNTTESAVTMGDFGGGLNARTHVELDDPPVKAQKQDDDNDDDEDEEEDEDIKSAGASGTLVMRLTNRETGKLEMILKRSRTKGSKMMIEETIHVPSGKVLKSVYFKQ